jgi:methionine-S-sulfoxide reductase
VRTRVGYAGGVRENPTYHRLGDHSESIQVDYDPSVISYERLLAIFWEEHDPTSKSWSTQYKTAVFYHNEEQKRLAAENRERLSGKLGKSIQTDLQPLNRFYPAEEYHQKYYLRQEKQFLKELQRYYAQDADLMNSTAAARLNGYLGRNGSEAGLKAEIDGLGLSDGLRAELIRLTGNRRAEAE